MLAAAYCHTLTSTAKQAATKHTVTPVTTDTAERSQWFGIGMSVKPGAMWSRRSRKYVEEV